LIENSNLNGEKEEETLLRQRREHAKREREREREKWTVRIKGEFEAFKGPLAEPNPFGFSSAKKQRYFFVFFFCKRKYLNLRAFFQSAEEKIFVFLSFFFSLESSSLFKAPPFSTGTNVVTGGMLFFNIGGDEDEEGNDGSTGTAKNLVGVPSDDDAAEVDFERTMDELWAEAGNPVQTTMVKHRLPEETHSRPAEVFHPHPERTHSEETAPEQVQEQVPKGRPPPRVKKNCNGCGSGVNLENDFRRKIIICRQCRAEEEVNTQKFKKRPKPGRKGRPKKVAKVVPEEANQLCGRGNDSDRLEVEGPEGTGGQRGGSKKRKRGGNGGGKNEEGTRKAAKVVVPEEAKQRRGSKKRKRGGNGGEKNEEGTRKAAKVVPEKVEQLDALQDEFVRLNQERWRKYREQRDARMLKAMQEVIEDLSGDLDDLQIEAGNLQFKLRETDDYDLYLYYVVEIINLLSGEDPVKAGDKKCVSTHCLLQYCQSAREFLSFWITIAKYRNSDELVVSLKSLSFKLSCFENRVRNY